MLRALECTRAAGHTFAPLPYMCVHVAHVEIDAMTTATTVTTIDATYYHLQLYCDYDYVVLCVALGTMLYVRVIHITCA